MPGRAVVENRRSLQIVGRDLYLPYSCNDQRVLRAEVKINPQAEILSRLFDDTDRNLIPAIANGMGAKLFDRAESHTPNLFARATYAAAEFSVRQYAHLTEVVDGGCITLRDATMEEHDGIHYAMQLLAAERIGRSAVTHG